MAAHHNSAITLTIFNSIHFQCQFDNIIILCENPTEHLSITEVLGRFKIGLVERAWGLVITCVKLMRKADTCTYNYKTVYK